ncbi:photosystem II D1 precursor processing protein PSB27-H2, chloroplastic isoform X3 [Herrania umbratica]|uniref:Photosystem II D1 precursor processing protein PSB27-H2, chloroplastic isoform X3 n=1 Tax=Herrania umbratica TaxID=108875 RepID=A0A6J1AX22_9ROSI|nr:photosystem II D1 precursor processing protein PSB27-H2, chloroplastic isoform X3 [Herrania umbratica]
MKAKALYRQRDCCHFVECKGYRYSNWIEIQERMALNAAAKICVPTVSNTMETVSRPETELWAEPDDQNQDDQAVVGAIKSLFDPNEKTKSGKVLPKAYLKSAREVVKTLRESLKEDPKDIVKFRRTADSAKESIRDYLSNWKGQDKVAREESYVQLEKAIRSLASFYSKAGPSAPLPEEIKNEILNDLTTAEEFL